MRHIPLLRTLVFASLAAILAPAIETSLYFLVLNLVEFIKGSVRHVEVGFAFVVLLYATIISAVHLLCLGLPFVWLLRRFNRLRMWTILVAGFLGGCVPVAILIWPENLNNVSGWIELAQFLAAMGLLGTSAALAFWLVFRRGIQHPGPGAHQIT